MKKIKVLIVDDSSTMRLILKEQLSGEPDIEVVGTAVDALDAREKVKALSPDVLTLDVEMPGMRGTEFLARLMRLRPMPVIMVSTLTEQGSIEAIKALELGAFECLVKPSTQNPTSFGELASKIRLAFEASSKISGPAERTVEKKPIASFEPNNAIVAVGCSTGGVEALQSVVSMFPANCAPTIVTQHMPSGFTRIFAARLDNCVAPTVVEAKHGMMIEPGHVYLAPGGDSHLEIVKGMCRLIPGDKVNGHRPSVDVLFSSVAKSTGDRAIGVILTGLGCDGANGLLEMRRSGARTLGQDESTSVVYGMPKAAFALGAVAKQLPLHKIGAEIVALTNSKGH
jgi:two-component system, chemotaxis family, protein-glutamate methylesterase/glutaminase